MLDPTEFQHWPEVPKEQRPKRLYHRGIIAGWEPHLTSLGWNVIDVRLLPNATDQDRADSLKCYLEGVRMGTIEAPKELAKWLELEARVYGLHAGKAMGTGVSRKTLEYEGEDAESVDFVLDFGKNRPWSTTLDQKAAATRRRTGPRIKKVVPEQEEE